jgi:hypothetical protein
VMIGLDVCTWMREIRVAMRTRLDCHIPARGRDRLLLLSPPP